MVALLVRAIGVRPLKAIRENGENERRAMEEWERKKTKGEMEETREQ